MKLLPHLPQLRDSTYLLTYLLTTRHSTSLQNTLEKSMHFTNTVAVMDLSTRIDLRKVAGAMTSVVYDPVKFNGLIWRHKRIAATALLFSTGKIVVSGPSTVKLAHKSARQYARLLQKQGFPVQPRAFKITTRSAVHTLAGTIPYSEIVGMLGGAHEPEIFHAATLKRGRINFIVYKSGKVVITGIKGGNEVSDIVRPTLLELELLTEC